MKQRRRASRRKWANEFIRLEKAAVIEAFTNEFLGLLLNKSEFEDRIRNSLEAELDRFIRRNTRGEVGEQRTWNKAHYDFSAHRYIYSLTTMAKRPFHSNHWRAK